jgi:hypothetical protein
MEVLLYPCVIVGFHKVFWICEFAVREQGGRESIDDSYA